MTATTNHVTVCAHLRHKSMYVAAAPDDHQRFYDAYDATAYWCTCTMKSIGPDGQPVHQDACKPGRECCEQ